MKRFFDIFVSLLLLGVTLPLLIMGLVGVLITSPGPLFYRAARVGRGRVVFTMLKLRTMNVKQSDFSAITRVDDGRVFPFGRLLRASKIDELPQLVNVLLGDMSLVGPRPEDPSIVEADYRSWMMESLECRPGLTSPGTLFGYVYGDTYLDDDAIEKSYAKQLLPRKLQVDVEYFRSNSLLSDLWVLIRTSIVVAALVCGVGVSNLVENEDLRNME